MPQRPQQEDYRIPAAPGGTAEKRGIQSLETGYLILRALQDASGGLPLAEIARRVGLSASAVHNYLVSLRRTGLVATAGRGVYRLGPSAFTLGLSALRLMDGFDIARAGAEALHQATNLTVTLCIWTDQGPVVVFKQDAVIFGALDLRPGLLLSPLGSAAGRAFVACLDPKITADVLTTLCRGQPADQADEVDQLRRDFVLRRHAEQDHFGGINVYRALAAPVWDDANELRYALVAMAPRAEFFGEHGPQMIADLISAAESISRMLGHVPTTPTQLSV